MPASCPGFATYSRLSNGQISVSGTIPIYTSAGTRQSIADAWGKFGGAIHRTARKSGIPASWLVGIMMAESKGNARACSPCSICSPQLCASGAGMRCCAFGLMQFIEQTAARYGTTPTRLVENPAHAIETAAELIMDLGERVGFDLVRIAAAYNGGFGRCGKVGTTFGWYTNGDYPLNVVKYNNTFIEQKLAVPASGGAGLLAAAAGLTAAWFVYQGKI